MHACIHTLLHYVTLHYITDRQTDRDRQRQTETDTETDRDRQRQTETETDRDRQRQTETRHGHGSMAGIISAWSWDIVMIYPLASSTFLLGLNLRSGKISVIQWLERRPHISFLTWAIGKGSYSLRAPKNRTDHHPSGHESMAKNSESKLFMNIHEHPWTSPYQYR